jgi:FkbM family methyltransferase
MAQALLRKYGLRLLKVMGRDIRIGHHWVAGQKIRLHSFKHKGYWWHGRNRERDAMETVAKLLRSGDTVIEVGAHIGYLTTYFAQLVGSKGHVLTFEPSDENADYLADNVRDLAWVTIDRHGVADFMGTARFFVESITGQNNSLYADYAVFDENAKNAGLTAERTEMSIEVTTIDHAVAEHGIAPNFVKIDIEGAELDALRGMTETLKTCQPAVFIEITKNTAECFALFADADYIALDEQLHPAAKFVDDGSGGERLATGNFFFVPRNYDRLNSLFNAKLASSPQLPTRHNA